MFSLHHEGWGIKLNSALGSKGMWCSEGFDKCLQVCVCVEGG